MFSKNVLFYAIFLLFLIFFILSTKSAENISEGFNEDLDTLSVKSYVLFVPKRLKSIRNIMNGIGLNPQYVKGPNKDLINIKTLVQKKIITQDWYDYSFKKKQKKKRGRKKANTGRIACHLGHSKIWKKFLKTSYKYALIFEDDLHIVPSEYSDVNLKIINVLKNIPPDAQIVYLGYCFEDCSLNTPYNNIFSNAIKPICRHAYLVNREGAEIILNKTKMMNIPGDLMISLLIKRKILKGYIVNSDYLSLSQNRQKKGIFKTHLGNHQSVLPLCIKIK